jgi:hypothetical protein
VDRLPVDVMDTSRMNWFVVASVPLYIGASITSLVNGNYAMSGAWFCWATANAFLVYAEYKI